MINKVILVGRLSNHPESKIVGNYIVCNFNLVIKRIKEDAIDVISCVAWGKQAENMSKYLNKGSLVSVIGHLKVDIVRQNDKDNFYTKVQVEELKFLETKEYSEYKRQKQNSNVRDDALF